MKRATLFITTLASVSLVSCTGMTYSSHFDCPHGTGVGCASLSKVNKMIDRHEIDLGDDDQPTGLKGGITKREGKQIYIYYGPDHLSRLMTLPESSKDNEAKGS